MALALPLIAGGVFYSWKVINDAQQFDQQVDKVNPVVKAQNVALGEVDTRILDSSVRKRHAMTQPEFFSRARGIQTQRSYKLYDPPANNDPSSNHNRAFIAARKQKHMNPQQVKRQNTASSEVVTTDMMARKLFKIDNSRWPY